MQRILLGFMACVLFATTLAHAQYGYGPSQQFDVGFGAGTVLAPSNAITAASHSPQTVGGGTFLNFSADYLFWRHVGIEGDVAWRASQNLYFGVQPFRPIFYDFNAIYAPPLGKHAQLEVLGGIGAQSTRFYTPNYNCSFYYCTNYFSSNHFMGDVGVGLRLYAYKGFFLRPEFREYFVNNNFEFSSAYSSRVGVTLGYSFGH